MTTEPRSKETKMNKNQTSVEMLRDEICGMICDHNGGGSFYSGKGTPELDTDATEQDSLESLRGTLTNTPHLLSWAWRGLPPTAEGQLASTRIFKMSLKPLTDRGSGHSGSMTGWLGSNLWALWAGPASRSTEHVWGGGATRARLTVDASNLGD